MNIFSCSKITLLQMCFFTNKNNPDVPAVVVVFELALVELHGKIWCLEVEGDHLTASIPEDLK